MAEAFTSYTVDNDRRFRNAIQRAIEETGNLKVPFGLIMADFYKSEAAIFSLKSPGQYPDYKNGGENSRYAQLKKKKVGFTYPLLVRSGKLAASLLSKDGPGAINSIGKTEMTIGTSVEYGIFHQSDRPRSRMPLRKFLFIGPEAPQFAVGPLAGRPERWMNILNDHVLKAIARSGAAT